MSIKDRAGNVWDLLADAPSEAENLRLRAQLMSRINDRLEEFGWSQRTAASNLELTQPRVSDLVTGKISKFSLDALVNIGIKVGVHLRVESEDAQDTHRAPQQGVALL